MAVGIPGQSPTLRMLLSSRKTGAYLLGLQNPTLEDSLREREKLFVLFLISVKFEREGRG